MKALVTGGGGFIARYIVEALLKQNHDVRVFCRGSYPELKKMGVEIYNGSLHRCDDIEHASYGIDTVFHCGAKVGMGGKYNEFYTTNVVGTRNLIQACNKNA